MESDSKEHEVSFWVLEMFKITFWSWLHDSENTLNILKIIVLYI